MITIPQNLPSPNQSIGAEGSIKPIFSRKALSEPVTPSICFTPTAPTNGGNTRGIKINEDKAILKGN